MPPVPEKVFSSMTLSPQDASILSAIACDLSIKENDPEVYRKLVGRLGSPFAEDVARALTGEEVVAQEASEAARAMLHWVDMKQGQVRQTRERLRASCRPLRLRAARSARPEAGTMAGD